MAYDTALGLTPVVSSAVFTILCLDISTKLTSWLSFSICILLLLLLLLRHMETVT